MNDEREDRDLQGLFAEQARRERGAVPAFEEVMGRGRGTRRWSMVRLAVAAGLLMVAGIGVSLVVQRGVRAPVERQAALPNLLEGLEDASNMSWQSPTAFLLDMSNTSGRSESAPPAGTNGSDTRHANG